MQLLRRAGAEVIFIQEQTCCGQPAYNSGYRQEALSVASTQIGNFKHDYPIIVPSASCAGMIKHQWPILFDGHVLQDEACAIAERTYELSEYLIEVLHVRLKDLGEAKKIALHNSCSSLREMNVSRHSEALLQQLSNIEIVEHERSRECCGFGGSFALKQADISGAMVKDKTTSLRNSGAEQVISQDCGCLMNIEGALRKQQSEGQNKLPGSHIAEFLWQRTHHETD